MSNSSSTTPPVRGYEFTVTNGQVTAEQYVSGSRSTTLKLPSGASFSVNPASAGVTETLTGSKEVDTVVFQADPLHAGLYQVASVTQTVTSPSITNAGGKTQGYTFTLSNGAVTAMQEVFGTRSFNLDLQPNAVFSVNAATHTITETLSQGNQLETISFVSPNGGSTYAYASDTVTYAAQGSATTALSISPWDRDKFTIDGTGAVTQVQAVRANGTLQTLTPNAAVKFTQLAAGYVLETVTGTNHSAYEVYHDGNGDGIYTAVAHGSGVTVDLVGLKAQISTAMEATL